MAGKTQAQEQKSIAELDQEIREVELETKKLQLSQAKRDNQQHTEDEESRVRRAEQAQRNLKTEAQNQVALEAACNHMTGGFGLDDLYNGDGKDSLITTDLPVAGTQMIVCTRCLGKWKTPEASLKKSNPKLYEAQMIEWRDIQKRARKSGAQPMGGPTFSFTNDDGVPVMPKMQ